METSNRQARGSIINPSRRQTGLKAASPVKNKPQSEIGYGLYSRYVARQLTQIASPGLPGTVASSEIIRLSQFIFLKKLPQSSVAAG